MAHQDLPRALGRTIQMITDQATGNTGGLR